MDGRVAMRTLLRQRYIRARLYGRYLVSSAQGGGLPVSDGRPRILVALAADYGNLGDVGITHAQIQLLRECFPEGDVVPWLISRTVSDLKSWQAALGPDDIITTVGGGNMGDLYDDIEYRRQLIIRKFPDHRIICFPQSVGFSHSIAGAIALRTAQRVYGSHRQLTLIGRDPDSLHLLQLSFPTCHVENSPDVVLSLDQGSTDRAREGIILTYRAHAEQGLNENDRESITATLEKIAPILVCGIDMSALAGYPWLKVWPS
jgi:pyruvyl transferase EpsI